MSTVKVNTIEPASGGTVTITGAALTTPALGTPASGNLANCTGLPAPSVVNTPSGGISATTVQAALNELDTDIAGKLGLRVGEAVAAALAGAPRPAAERRKRGCPGRGRRSAMDLKQAMDEDYRRRERQDLAAHNLVALGWPLHYDATAGWSLAWDQYDHKRGERVPCLLGLALQTLTYKRECPCPRTGDPYARLGSNADPVLIERLLREQPEFARQAMRIIAEAPRPATAPAQQCDGAVFVGLAPRRCDRDAAPGTSKCAECGKS